MSSPLPEWKRELYAAYNADGGFAPFLFFVVFGCDIGALNLSPAKYRCDEVPKGIEVRASGPGKNPEVLDSFRKGPLWEDLRSTNSWLADLIAVQTTCVTIKGTVEDASTLNYMRNTIGLVTALLDTGGVAVFDPQTFEWWSREEWMDKIFRPEQRRSHRQVTIVVTEQGDGKEWFHTRGMRKFGRPDISVQDVKPERREAVTDMLNRFIIHQALGGTINEGQKIIDIEGLPAGMYCVHGVDPQDPRFNNSHVEVKWPSA